MGKKPKDVEYANRVLSTLSEIPAEYWEDVLDLVTQYFKYLKEEGHIPKRKKKARGRSRAHN